MSDSDDFSNDLDLVANGQNPDEITPADIEELLEFDDSSLDDNERAVFEIARKVVTSKTTIVSSGPLPPGKELAEYEAACPGAADRIIAMAEKQSDHRMNMEKRCLEGNIEADQDDRNKQFKLSAIGSVSALIICMTIVVFGGFCLLEGRSISGFGSMAIALGSIGGIFAYTRSKRASREETSADNQPTKDEKPSDITDDLASDPM